MKPHYSQNKCEIINNTFCCKPKYKICTLKYIIDNFRETFAVHFFFLLNLLSKLYLLNSVH